MTTPIAGAQAGPGTALYAGQAATVQWTTGGTEEIAYIDLGFVPSIAFVHDLTSDLSFWWHPGMTAGSSVEFSDGKMDANTLTAFHTSGQPKVVPTTKFFIRANTVVTSTASTTDYIIGLSIDVDTTADDAVMYLIAFP